MMARAALTVAAAGSLASAHADVKIGDSVNPGYWDGAEIIFDNEAGRIAFNQGGTITGLSDAVLSDTSTDAVTGRQVFAVDQKAGVALASIADLTASAVTFNADKSAINAQNAKITNLQNGVVSAGSAEAVTGGQLFTVDQKVQTTQNALTALDASAVKYNAAKTEINVGDAKITNAQNGAVAAGSKEVVTGGQRFTTNQEVNTINQRLTQSGLATAGTPYNGIKYFRATSTKADAIAAGADAIAIGPEASAAAASSLALGQGENALSTAEGAIVVGTAAETAGARAV